MKTIPPPCPEPETGPKYWRSLDQLAEAPEFKEWVQREFPSGASEFTDPQGRRHFLKIMSASFVLAGLGLTGCRRPEENVLPFGKAQGSYIHGVPQFYATAMPTRGSAIPLLVKSSDGRPTKVEGNPLHPDSNGGTDQFAQASILNLYDPDRAMRFAKNGGGISREAALDEVAVISKNAQANGGKGLAILMERSSSPSRTRLVKQLAQQFADARFFIYEPVDFAIHQKAASIAFGRSVTPYFKFDEAKNVIVSLDCDFIGTEEDSYINVRRYAKGRKISKPGDSMNRLYAVEGLLTLTGSNADHRLRVATSQVQAVAARLALEILGASHPLASTLKSLSDGTAASEKWIVECAKDLSANKGVSLVVAGYRQPLAVHLLANAINAALENVGKTVVLMDTPPAAEGTIQDLASLINSGQVDTLISLGGNPSFNAPAELGWPALMTKVKNIVRLGYHEDESFPLTNGWHLPQAHYLESWGDARAADGTVVSVQPLIEPLFGGISELEVLARLAGSATVNPHEIVRETIRGLSGGGENEWRKFLHDGLLVGTAYPAVTPPINTGDVVKEVGMAKPAAAPGKSGLEVVFHRDSRMDDGRFNNNGWLQETPDPITKLTWDNAIVISPKTAEELGVGRFDDKAKTSQAVRGLFENEVVEVNVNGKSIRGAVWIQPGLADNTVAVALGYGRIKSGRVGRGQDGLPVGFNAYPIRTSTSQHFATGAKLNKTAEIRLLACTQEHGSMEGRPVFREANLKNFEKNPHFAHEMDLDAPEETGHIAKDSTGAPKKLYPRPPLNGVHQWGMVVDLNSCVGCTACQLACQSENNVPIVGKDQVRRGREMSWLRLDRYYAGSVYDPQVVIQPIMCQHCEDAPCENVCPVNATSHDDEGLNLMTYNRCVGTRYCSNNCPYKVRRFNFLDYNRRSLNQLVGPFYSTPLVNSTDGEWNLWRWWKNPDKGIRPDDEWEILKLAKNPDVSVRMRGVMEKCTYCVQRLEQAKIAKKIKPVQSGVSPSGSGDVKLSEHDGSMPKTACQAACPAEAIVFGDISDPKSTVSLQKKFPHNYSVLGFLDTKPRTTYLARIRNPNPEMPDHHADYPDTLKDYEAIRHDNPFEPAGEEAKAKGEH